MWRAGQARRNPTAVTGKRQGAALDSWFEPLFNKPRRRLLSLYPWNDSVRDSQVQRMNAPEILARFQCFPQME